MPCTYAKYNLLCLKSQPFRLLSGSRKAALYCDWLSRPSLANHNTELSRNLLETKTKGRDFKLAKGRLISKRNFGLFNSPKKQT